LKSPKNSQKSAGSNAIRDDFGAFRSGVDVAAMAPLVAQFPNINRMSVMRGIAAALVRIRAGESKFVRASQNCSKG
jgi:hypothetical protein